MVYKINFYFPQLVTMCPDSIVPSLSWCKKSTESEEEEEDEEEQETDDPVSGRGQILWVRGLTRLQQQVGDILASLTV